MSRFNYDFFGTNLDYLWSFKVSEDGRTALVGFGDDEGKLIQFDIEKREISKSYWTEGSYTLSIEFLNAKAIIGTNNGFILSVDLERKEILRKKQISNKSIKNLKLSNDKKEMLVITSNEILLFDAESLEILHKRELDYNPWDIVVIPNSNFVAIGGSSNKLELLNSKRFEIIDSICCGEEYRDVSSLLYDEKSALLVSGTEESGTLDMWKVSINGLKKDKEYKIGDNIYWLQGTDEYIAFSTTQTDIVVYWIEKQKLLRIPEALGEARFSLTSIDNETYLLYQKKNKNLYLTNLTKGKIDFFELTDLPYEVKFIDLTSNGDIIAITQKGIIVSNFLNNNKDINTLYDFNSKEKNIAVENFVFNEVDESIALQCKDESIKVISLVDSKVSSVNLSLNDIYSPEIKDFYGENLLLSSYKDVCIINSTTNQLKEIINQDENFISINKIKLINNNQYAIVNNSDYGATPIVWDYLKVYDLEGQEISRKKLEDIFSSMFVSNNKLVTTSMHNPSEIINIETNEVKQFDIGYCFDENDGTMLFDNEKYCIRIAIGNHFNYYITCYNLMKKNENGDAQIMWENEAPWLSSFIPLSYCKIDGYFYIVNKDGGEIISLNISNGDMISSYRVEKNIVDIKMSNSGKYIAWRLKTGEFSYISYPFKSCEVSDE